MAFSVWPECGLPRCLAREPRVHVIPNVGTSHHTHTLSMPCLGDCLVSCPWMVWCLRAPMQLRQATMPRGEVPWGETNERFMITIQQLVVRGFATEHHASAAEPDLNMAALDPAFASRYAPSRIFFFFFCHLPWSSCQSISPVM